MALLIVGAVLSATAQGDAQERADVDVQNAVSGVLDAFRDHRLVGLGERHGLREAWDFYAAVATDPRFPDVASDVVLEIANARYQAVLDSFVVMGADIPLERVRPVWRDATNSLLQGGDPPEMEQFLETVRQANARRGVDRRVRVLAGDPPIDWSRVRSARDFYAYLGQREAHYPDVVRREVLERDRRALLVMGRSHMTRASATDGGSVAMRLEAIAPGELFIVNLMVDPPARLRSAAEAWHAPALVSVRGSWVGELTPPFLDADVKSAGSTYTTTMDAVLFLGAEDDLHPVPERPFDDAHLSELRRRRAAVDAGGNHQRGVPNR